MKAGTSIKAAAFLSILCAVSAAQADPESVVLVCGKTTYTIDYSKQTIDWGYGPVTIQVTDGAVTWNTQNDYTHESFYYHLDRYSGLLTSYPTDQQNDVTTVSCKRAEKQF